MYWSRRRLKVFLFRWINLNCCVMILTVRSISGLGWVGRHKIYDESAMIYCLWLTDSTNYSLVANVNAYETTVCHYFSEPCCYNVANCGTYVATMLLLQWTLLLQCCYQWEPCCYFSDTCCCNVAILLCCYFGEPHCCNAASSVNHVATMLLALEGLLLQCH